MLRSEWNRLVYRSFVPTPFLTHEYMSTYWINLRTFCRLFLLEVRNPNGTLVGLAPLIMRTKGGERCLEFLCHGLAEYQDFIIDKDYAAGVYGSFIDWIDQHRDRWNRLELGPFPPGSPSAKIIVEYAQRRSFEISEKLRTYPQIYLTESWEAYLSGQPKNRREDIRYNERLLDRELSPVTCLPFEGNFRRCYRDFLELHMERFPTLTKTLSQFGWLKRFRLFRFARSYNEAFYKKGWLRCARMDVGDDLLAGLTFYDFDDVLYLCFLVWNPAVVNGRNANKRVSPGSVLLGRLIDYGIRHQKRRLDLLTGEEPYKYRLGASGQSVAELIVNKKPETTRSS